MPSINKINDPVGRNREWPEKAVHVWWREGRVGMRVYIRLIYIVPIYGRRRDAAGSS